MNKTKVLIVTYSLADGGAERSAALLSILLSDTGYDVHIASVIDRIDYDFKGQLLNLGLMKNKNDTLFGRFQRLLTLKKYIREHNFDWIIDNRTRTVSWSEFIISGFVYPPKKAIYVVRNFKIDLYFPASKFIAKIIYRKSPYIVAVSDEAKHAIEQAYGYKNAIRIYNPASSEKIVQMSKESTIPGKFILSYGRIEDESKNLSLLIDAYAKSNLPAKEILLYIMGNGPDEQLLKDKAISLGMADKIIFMQKQINPFPYVKSALFTVLTSRYEGFPRVVIESLAIGTPVVSVDCSSGPKEIIRNEENGLLVENYDAEKFTAALNRFVEDSNLYDICKSNAQSSIAHLSPENIAVHWQKILS